MGKGKEEAREKCKMTGVEVINVERFGREAKSRFDSNFGHKRFSFFFSPSTQLSKFELRDESRGQFFACYEGQPASIQYNHPAQSDS